MKESINSVEALSNCADYCTRESWLTPPAGFLDSWSSEKHMPAFLPPGLGQGCQRWWEKICRRSMKHRIWPEFPHSAPTSPSGKEDGGHLHWRCFTYTWWGQWRHSTASSRGTWGSLSLGVTNWVWCWDGAIGQQSGSRWPGTPSFTRKQSCPAMTKEEWGSWLWCSVTSLSTWTFKQQSLLNISSVDILLPGLYVTLIPACSSSLSLYNLNDYATYLLCCMRPWALFYRW